MAEAASRTDSSHDIRYPTAGDARGSTRINHLRRPYYMGPFESPQSYIMFGLWKQRLLETGEAPETKDLRPIVDDLISNPSLFAKVTSHRSFIPAVVFGAVILSLAIVSGSIIFSTYKPPAVDKQALSANEIEFIRAYRSTETAAEADSKEIDRVAALTSKLMDERARNALHRYAGTGK